MRLRLEKVVLNGEVNTDDDVISVVADGKKLPESS